MDRRAFLKGIIAAMTFPHVGAGFANPGQFSRLVVTISKAGQGIFIYSPSVGFGNLIGSIASQAGTDHGNAYLPGIVNYLNGNTAVQLIAGGIAFNTAPGAGGPWTQLGAISDSVWTDSSAISLKIGASTILQLLAAAANINAATVISAGVIGGNVLDVINSTGGGAAPVSRVTAAAIGDSFLGLRVSGDTNARFTADTSAGGLVRIRLGPGNAVPDVIIERAAANLLSILTADLDIATIGRGLRVAEGANAKQGTARLTAGAVTVANTSVTANSRIFLTVQDAAFVGTQGILRIGSRVAGTSFTVNSTSNTDDTTFAYEIVEPG